MMKWTKSLLVCRGVVLLPLALLTCAPPAAAVVVNSNVTNGVFQNTTAVLLDSTAAFGVCVYPTSGAYSFLVRLLYYCTLIFSLFSRAHLWLVAGALAAALTYAGSAAVHACLLVWRGPNPYIEDDSWVLYAILNSACLITVPLLNWSGTLRRLGAKAASIKDPKRAHTQGNVSTRTIVIYWAFLVLVGYICIWQQVLFGDGETGLEYPDMNKVMCASGTNASLLISENGTYYKRAIDVQFIQDNGCTDPCNQINIPSIFRQQNDLVLLDHKKALLYDGALPGKKYEQAEKYLNAEDKLFSVDYYTLPFILVQGFISALFGRRDPREIRDLIYIKLFMGQRPLSSKPSLVRTQDFLVRFLAALNYILAVAVVILCPPLFIVSLISSELQFWNSQPDAEAPYSVGQWEPWAVTCQVLLAALIARYHDRIIWFICSLWRRGTHSSSRDHESVPLKKKTSDEEHGQAASIPASPATLFPNANPAAGKPDVRPTVSPLQHQQEQLNADQGRGPKRLWHVCRDSVFHSYKMLAHPLNQSDRGLFDEISNFFRWCQDPCAVSRLVVRHPIRPRDVREGDEQVGLIGQAGENGEIDEEKKMHLDEEGKLGGDGNDEDGQGERMNSAFFRGRTIHDR